MQNCTSLSTTEVEYIATVEACKEAIWLAHLVKDLGMIVEMPTLHCDSQSAIMMAKNPIFHAKTKHIDVKYHFIMDMLEDKLMKLVKVHIYDNPTNLMTKGLPLERFAQCHALHCDSQSAIMLAKNQLLHSKTKHIDLKYHFIRDMLV